MDKEQREAQTALDQVLTQLEGEPDIAALSAAAAGRKIILPAEIKRCLGRAVVFFMWYGDAEGLPADFDSKDLAQRFAMEVTEAEAREVQ